MNTTEQTPRHVARLRREIEGLTRTCERLDTKIKAATSRKEMDAANAYRLQHEGVTAQLNRWRELLAAAERST